MSDFVSKEQGTGWDQIEGRPVANWITGYITDGTFAGSYWIIDPQSGTGRAISLSELESSTIRAYEDDNYYDGAPENVPLQDLPDEERQALEQEAQEQADAEFMAEVNATPKTLDPSYVAELNRLLEYAEALRPTIVLPGLEVNQLSFIEWMMAKHNLTYEDALSLDPSWFDMRYKVDALLQIHQLSGLPFVTPEVLGSIYASLGVPSEVMDLIAENAGSEMLFFDLMDSLDPEVLQQINAIDPNQFDSMIQGMGQLADFIGVDEEAYGDILDEASLFTLGYQEAEITDENRAEVLAEAKAEIEAYANGKAEIVAEQLATLDGKIQEIRDIGDVFGKPTAPVADAFQAVYDSQKDLHEVKIGLIDLQEESIFVNSPPEQQLSMTYERWLEDLGQSIPDNFTELDLEAQRKLVTDTINEQYPITGTTWGESSEGALMLGQFNDQEALIKGEMTSGQWLQIGAALTFFALGFVPVVGQVMTIADIVTDLARGDLVSAGANLIFGLDEINDLRRLMRRSRKLADGAEALYRQIPRGVSNATDVPNEAAKLRRSVNSIEDGLGNSQADNVRQWSSRTTSTDYMAGGRVPGEPFTGSYREQEIARLESMGVSVNENADDLLPQGKTAAFRVTGDSADNPGLEMLLKANPTLFEYWHELRHFNHYNQLGYEAYTWLGRVTPRGDEYVEIAWKGRYIKELFVWDELRKIRDQLNTDELRDAADYVFYFQRKYRLWEELVLGELTTFNERFPDLDLGVDEALIRESFQLDYKIIDNSYQNADKFDEKWRR